MSTVSGRQLQRWRALGIVIGAVLAVCACGSSGPGAALSPIIPPGPRVMSGCIVHHDLTLQGDTIDGATGGIDVQSTATGPGFEPGAPCIPTMLESMVGDFVYAIPAIPTGDVLGCHLPIEDVYFAPSAGDKTGLAAATIECQQSGADGQGRRLWWGGVVSGILVTPPPVPQETQGPLPNPKQVVCRILLTMKDGDPNQPVMELVEGTTQRVCQSFSMLTRPESVTSGKSVSSVPSSYQRICDRRDAYVFAPSQGDEDNLQLCPVLAR